MRKKYQNWTYQCSHTYQKPGQGLFTQHGKPVQVTHVPDTNQAKIERVDHKYPLPLFLLSLGKVPPECRDDAYMALWRLAHHKHDLIVGNVSCYEYGFEPPALYQVSLSEQLIKHHTANRSYVGLWELADEQAGKNRNTHQKPYVWADFLAGIRRVGELLKECPVVLVCDCENALEEGHACHLDVIGKYFANKNHNREVWELLFPYSTYKLILPDEQGL